MQETVSDFERYHEVGNYLPHELPIKRDYATRHVDGLPIAHTQIRCVAPKKDDLTRLRKDGIMPRCCAGRWRNKYVYNTALVSLL